MREVRATRRSATERRYGGRVARAASGRTCSVLIPQRRGPSAALTCSPSEAVTPVICDVADRDERRSRATTSSRGASPSSDDEAETERSSAGHGECGQARPLAQSFDPFRAVPSMMSELPTAVDVAGAQRQQQVARAQFAGAGSASAARGSRHPGHALAAAGVGGRLGDEQAGDAREVLRRARARGRCRAPRRGRPAASAAPNSVASRCGARVQVRLEDGDHAAGRERARGLDRRGDLGRVVRVVVDHQRAARRSCRARSKRRPAPSKSRSAAAAAARSAPASRAAVSAAAALRRVVGARDARARPSTPST